MTEERERRFVSEFMHETFPLGNYSINVPLGPLPKETIDQLGLNDAAAFMRPYRRRIDAVAWSQHWYILIEAKIRDALEGIGRLQTYRDLAKRTPDLPGYTGQPFESWLVAPWALDWIQIAVTQADIKLKLYKPAWIDGYVEERKRYYRAPYRRARADMMQARRVLGVDKIIPPEEST